MPFQNFVISFDCYGNISDFNDITDFFFTYKNFLARYDINSLWSLKYNSFDKDNLNKIVKLINKDYRSSISSHNRKHLQLLKKSLKHLYCCRHSSFLNYKFDCHM